MKTLIFSLLPILLILGCAAKPSMMQTLDYQARPELKHSLFSSDQAVLNDEAIDAILNGKVTLPDKIKIAIMRYSRDDQEKMIKYYGYFYWRTEEYLKTHQEYIDSLSSIILSSQRILEATVMPEMITPNNPSIAILREAAVRLQADMLLVIDIQSNIYEKWTFWGKDKLKAYGTCEAVLLDVRTGIIPFTTIITEDFETSKEQQDFNIDDARKRAEKSAVLQALEITGKQIADFLNSVP